MNEPPKESNYISCSAIFTGFFTMICLLLTWWIVLK